MKNQKTRLIFILLFVGVLSVSFGLNYIYSFIEVENSNIINSKGLTINTRFTTPPDYQRIVTEEHSFGYYLRNLPLKKHLSKVYLFNGNEKNRQDVHEAVVEMEIGKSDLQQCADAIMRLRAEYLFKEKRYNDIHFNFTNGFNAEYVKWRDGYRINVNGNKTTWVKKTKADSSYLVFRQYLDKVFTYAGTRSLSKELKCVKEMRDMQIGDVFILGGSPGHAVLIVDMAVNIKNGNKIFMMVQSYMPAQQIHILKNFNNKAISPWYLVEDSKTIMTPEWDFESENLKRF